MVSKEVRKQIGEELEVVFDDKQPKQLLQLFNKKLIEQLEKTSDKALTKYISDIDVVLARFNISYEEVEKLIHNFVESGKVEIDFERLKGTHNFVETGKVEIDFERLKGRAKDELGKFSLATCLLADELFGNLKKRADELLEDIAKAPEDEDGSIYLSEFYVSAMNFIEGLIPHEMRRIYRAMEKLRFDLYENDLEDGSIDKEAVAIILRNFKKHGVFSTQSLFSHHKRAELPLKDNNHD